jgi:hypothetical protein
MALRVHSGRRATIEPARLAPPDSSLARDAREAAEDLLAPVLRNHLHRAYAWAAAVAARDGISFDRELLYLAAMLHDTGLPSPAPHVDFHRAQRGGYLMSAGAAVDVFGLRSNEIPDAVRRSVVAQFPRLGFKREFAALWRAEADRVPRGRAWFPPRFAVTDLGIRMAPFG